MGREELLRCSLGIAGLTERVNITRMPFAGEVFDSVVSKHAMFHLWENGCCGGLTEVCRYCVRVDGFSWWSYCPDGATSG
jgi:hypothetical protein